MDPNKEVVYKFIENRIDKHDQKIKELNEQIKNIEKEKECLGYCGTNCVYWENLRKTIYNEYFATLPKSMGSLKGRKKERSDKLRKEYNEFFRIYDTYYELENQTYFYTRESSDITSLPTSQEENQHETAIQLFSKHIIS
jgi:hypothetical protein